MSVNMSAPKPAGTAEILRSLQTDEFHLRNLRNLTAEIIQRCLGIPVWLKWKDLCSALSDALFFSLTSLTGLQTLGEEYANIIQVDASLKAIPSIWRRALDVSLRTFGPSLLPPHEAFALLLRLHLVAFYFRGDYRSFAKRIAGIRFVVIRRWLSQSSQQYRILGWIAALQLCLLLMTRASREVAPPRESGGGGTEEEVEQRCSLCFERRRSPTATPCGHLFCWTCITSWMHNKEECPLCRESFVPSKLICLQRYH